MHNFLSLMDNSPGPNHEPPEGDILLVMEQTARSKEACRRALVATAGDIVFAIMVR